MISRVKAQVISDPRGWLVVPVERSDLLALGNELRAALRADEVVAQRGGYLVRADSLVGLVELYPPDSGAWPDEGVERVRSVADLASRHSQARLEVADALEDPYRALAGYPGLSLLDDHQVEAVAAMTVPSLVGLGLFDEQGTGKTITALAAFDVLRQRGEAERLLVIGPKSVLPTWRDDARLVFGESARVALLWGDREARRAAMSEEHDIALITYESVVGDLVYLRALLEKHEGGYVLVVDESYYVKNPAARRSAAIAQLRPHCARAFVLCGTPAPNSARDIVNQLDLADAGATFGGVRLPPSQIGQHDVVRQALDDSAIILRRLKEDVLDIPQKQLERVFVRFQPVQAGLYDAALESLVSDVLAADEAQFRRDLGTYMGRRSALLQICSDPGAVVEDYDEAPAKYLALDTLLSELVEGQQEKVVVWSFYRYTLARLADRYSHYGLVRVDGSVTSPVERGNAIDAFQNDPSVKVFLGNPAAAGAGITLTAASHAIYESFSNQPAHYLQSVDRIHRRGQARPAVSHVLITAGSVDEVQFERLLDKEESARMLLRDPVNEPITRSRFLRSIGTGEHEFASKGALDS